MINIWRQPQVCITTSLIGRYHQLLSINLKLYQTKAWRLVTFGTGLAQEQHVVLATTFLPVDFLYKRRQSGEIGRITVYKNAPAIISPTYTGFPVFLHRPLPFHKQLKLITKFTAGNVMTLKISSRSEGVKTNCSFNRYLILPFLLLWVLPDARILSNIL